MAVKLQSELLQGIVSVFAMMFGRDIDSPMIPRHKRQLLERTLRELDNKFLSVEESSKNKKED